MKTEGTLVIKSYDGKGSNSTMVRSAINASHDATLCYKALEFRDAAWRDGRVAIIAIVPRWKYWLLRAIGIKKRDLVRKLVHK